MVENACCTGDSVSPWARPSMVVISRPAQLTASDRQPRTVLPSIMTEQAPQTP